MVTLYGERITRGLKERPSDSFKNFEHYFNSFDNLEYAIGLRLTPG